MVDNSEHAHIRLEAEVNATKLKLGQSITSYMVLHQNLRRLMSQASYQNITNESTSVHFQVYGLKDHHSFREMARTLCLTGLTESIRTLEERFLEEDLSMSNSTPFGLYRAHHDNAGTGNSTGQ